jgi:hypothetical protein
MHARDISPVNNNENSTSDVNIVERILSAYLLTNSTSKIINAMDIVSENDPNF